MSFDWKSLIGNVAPSIATVIGGPASGMAVKFIAEALGLKADAKEEDITEAIKSDPDAFIKLKQAEMAFKKHMADNDLKIKELAFSDVKDARTRQEKLKDNTPTILGGAVVLGFFCASFLVLTGYVGVTDAVAGTILGYISAKAEQVISYYFGSSVGSKQKTDLMNGMK